MLTCYDNNINENGRIVALRDAEILLAPHQTCGCTSTDPHIMGLIDPYGRILAETWRAGDDMVVADLDAALLENATGRRWIKTRRPELYGEIAQPTGQEVDTRNVRFDKKGA